MIPLLNSVDQRLHFVRSFKLGITSFQTSDLLEFLLETVFEVGYALRQDLRTQNRFYSHFRRLVHELRVYVFATLEPPELRFLEFLGNGA
jgi:hypothetical protein